ncbi:MAG: tetratricopeptide repeat protein, partial [Verrucomicrobiia bacterium]
HGMVVPPVPAGYMQVRNPFGVLTNIPVVWLALAVPLAWRSRSAQAGPVLRWFVAAAALLFGMCALTLGLFCGASFRYEVDFLPTLLLLAVVGILGLERALADRLVWRRAARWGWGLLLGFSVAFNLLASVDYYAEAHNNLGVALVRLDKLQEATGQFEQALRIEPEYAAAHNSLGVVFVRLGRTQEAITQFEQAVRIKPEFAEAHNNLGIALERAGRVQEALGHFEQALQLAPDYSDTHNNLAAVLFRLGRLPEAIGHYEQMLRIKPDNAAAHYNLGVALEQTGKLKEAIGHYEQALRIKPDMAEAQNALARLQPRQ